MAITYKVLGQANPVAATLTTLYTVPAGTQAVCSTLVIANLSATATTYRIAVRPAGAAIVNQHYQAFDVPLAANDAVGWTIGMTLGVGDVVSVQAASANVAFTLFGSEHV